MQRKAILVLSDQPVMRQGLVNIISGQTDMQVVGDIDIGVEALNLYAQQSPDIVIIETSLSEAQGIRIAKAIRLIDDGAKIIILTACHDDRFTRQFIKAGAFAIHLTNILIVTLIETIRHVSAGKRSIDIKILEALCFDVAPHLSVREVQVLAYVAKGHTNSTIGTLLGIAAETVKTHLKNSIGKLGASNRTEAVIIAMRRGLLEL